MPAYRAEKTLAQCYAAIPHDIVDSVLLVDDGSDDATLAVARELGLVTHRHPRNLGYGANQKTCYGAISCPTKYFDDASEIGFRRSVVYGLGVLRVSLQYALWRRRRDAAHLFRRARMAVARASGDRPRPDDGRLRLAQPAGSGWRTVTSVERTARSTRGPDPWSALLLGAFVAGAALRSGSSTSRS